MRCTTELRPSLGCGIYLHHVVSLMDPDITAHFFFVTPFPPPRLQDESCGWDAGLPPDVWCSH